LTEFGDEHAIRRGIERARTLLFSDDEENTPMKAYTRYSTTTRRKIRYCLLGATFAGAGVIASACLDRPLCATKVDAKGHVVEDCRPRTTNMFVDTAPGAPVDKIDFLFLIDNSSSMSDKQEVLRAAVPDLVDRFVNPVCIDEAGNRAVAASPEERCPSGMKREFPPVRDIHVGIITSSLGGHGTAPRSANRMRP
jgi:hypothetical protein